MQHFTTYRRLIMNPMTQEIIGQILGIIATIITFLSYQMHSLLFLKYS